MKLFPCALMLCFGSLCLLSCQQRLYFPDRANTPALSEAHEGKLTLSAKPQTNYSDSLHGNGGGACFAADAAFAPVNHLGIIASWRTINKRRIDEESLVNHVYGGVFTGHRLEGGLGYFTTFGRMGRAEVYTGYGQGTLERSGYYTPERDFKTRYHRFFLQPAAGAGNERFSATAGLRLAFQRYYNFTSPDPTLRYHILDDGGSVDVEAETVGFIEPFINGEIGWRFIRFNLQVGATAQYLGANVSGNLPLYLSMGVAFDLAPSYFRTPSKASGHPARR